MWVEPRARFLTRRWNSSSLPTILMFGLNTASGLLACFHQLSVLATMQNPLSAPFRCSPG